MKVKPYLLLYMAMICVGMGQTVIFAVMPMLGRELGLHLISFQLPLLGEVHPRELTITLLSALTALTFSLVSPFWGRLSDRSGRKPAIVAGLLGYSAGILLFSSVAWAGLTGMLSGVALYMALILTRFVHSTFMSAAMPASSAYVVDVTHESVRSHALGRLTAFMQLGVMCGPVLAWLMSIHFLMPFFVQAALMFCMGIAMLLMFPYHKPERRPERQEKLRYRDKRFMVYLLLVWLVYAGVGMVQQTLGFYFQDVLSLEPVAAARQYAISMVFSSAAMLFSQLVLVRFLRAGPFSLVRYGLPVIVAGYVCLSIAGNLWLLIAGMVLFGLGMGLSAPNLAAAASFTVEHHEQGALAGLIASVRGFGFVAGPLLGGMIYAYSNSLTYDVAATLVGVAMIYVILKALPGEK